MANADWKQSLEQVVRRSQASVLGWEKIRHRQHALLVTTALNAFGADPRATLFIEAMAPSGHIPRPDLILLHPEVGIAVIENKGVTLEDIHAVSGTTLTLWRDGRLKNEDPFLQAEQVAFRLRDLMARRIDLLEALFLRAVALPRINRQEFERRFHTRWPQETFFQEAIANPDLFRAELLAHAYTCQRIANRRSRLSKRAHDAVMVVLSGKGVLSAPRRSYVESDDSSLLGVQIQELELALKEATPQQKELGNADFRGQHRLFRGVAGSGKSIMLALNVAAMMGRFETQQGELFETSPMRKRILVVCINRTLTHYLRQRIDERYGRLTWGTADAEILTVVHLEELIRRIGCLEPALNTGISYKERQRRAETLSIAFDLLAPRYQGIHQYEAVYVDEAQDLFQEEITFLLKLARPDEQGRQTFVIFYDNAQNIYGVTLPVWDKLGVNILGGRTVFLDQCLRNTVEVLAFAFNVLVGSFAPEGERVVTRTIADVAGLRQRGLITERGDRFDIHFSRRHGPRPVVRIFQTRQQEIDAMVDDVARLISREKVLPRDILIVYKHHYAYKGALEDRLRERISNDIQIRLVDSDHYANKDRPLIEDQVLTISTIASAKGYDAPIVLMMGADELATDTNGRASFYVGATRAKLHLIVSGVRRNYPTLLDEAWRASRELDQPTSPAP